MQLMQIWYYRITYDKTAIQIQLPNIKFEESFYFRLVNGTNQYDTTTNAPAASKARWNYRNYLMGTNGMNIGSQGATNYYLYHKFYGGYNR